MASYRLAPEVEAELDDIWLYLARNSNSIEIADRVIEAITEQFWLLASNPHIGRRRDADLRPGLRSFPVGQYIIIYRIESGMVLVLHVVHANEISRLCLEIEFRPGSS
jgi:toxin ParE1/3/4